MSQKLVKSKKLMIASDSIVEDEKDNIIELTISDEVWHAFSKQYNADNSIQPITEIFDNAIAAIISKEEKIKGTIYVRVNSDGTRGSIEHSGGTTFPTDISGIQRVLSQGGKKQTSLNEHGCGLKTALANLDPHNSSWKIWIKYVQDGNQKIMSIQSPYCSKMKIVHESVWPGEDKTIEPGSYIEFPIKKETHFRQLYSKHGAKMEMSDVGNRIQSYISNVWMYIPAYKDGSITIKYNGKTIKPFSFMFEGEQNTHDKYIQSYQSPTTVELSTGGKVEFIQLILKNESAIPGSHLFKYSLDRTGIYLFKNGRFIQFTKSTQEYSALYGSKPHNSHNGYIKIINMIGTQPQLPETITTKTSFISSDIYQEVIDKCATISIKPNSEDSKVAEATIVKDFINSQKNRLSDVVEDYMIRENKKIELPGGNSTPPIDVIETYKTTKGEICNLYEFKREKIVKLEYIWQLYGNWLLSKDADELQEKIITPILVVGTNDIDDTIIPNSIVYAIKKLEICQFKPKIMNMDRVILYPKK